MSVSHAGQALLPSVGVSIIDRDSTPPCGVHRYAANVVYALVNGGHRVRVYTNPRFQIKHFLPPETIERLSVTYLSTGVDAAVATQMLHLTLLPLRARRDGIDVLHVTNARLYVKSVPTVMTVHDVADLSIHSKYSLGRTAYRRYLLYPFLRTQALLATVSEHAKADLIEKLGVAGERIVVTPNVVGHQLLDQNGPRTGTPNIIYVGRIDHPSKNLLTLIAAFDIAAALDPELQLHMIGADSWNALTVRRYAAAARFAGRIHFHGWVDDRELKSRIRAATALCLPSLFEGYGLPAAEAIALGTPVLAADAGSLPEVVGPQSAGLLPASDVEAWAAAIGKLRSDPDRAHQLAAEQKAHQSSNSGEDLLDILRALYGRVLASA